MPNLFGWIPDIPDVRDFIFKLGFPVETTPLPKKVDLRSYLPEIWNQGQIGCCTGMSVSGAIQFNLKKQQLAEFTPSPLFAYYNGRLYEGTTRLDAGAMIRDVIKGVNEYGICALPSWPTEPKKVIIKPTKAAYTHAKTTKAVRYERIPRSLNEFKAALATGFPFIFGFAVYESFQSDTVAKTGIVPEPSTKEKMLGGHAVLACGFDDEKQHFIIRNSWGSNWGDQGHFYLPYSFFTNSNLTDDFWVIYSVSGEHLKPKDITQLENTQQLGWNDK